jgi:hypothetical protein
MKRKTRRRRGRRTLQQHPFKQHHFKFCTHTWPPSEDQNFTGLELVVEHLPNKPEVLSSNSQPILHIQKPRMDF